MCVCVCVCVKSGSLIMLILNHLLMAVVVPILTTASEAMLKFEMALTIESQLFATAYAQDLKSFKEVAGCEKDSICSTPDSCWDCSHGDQCGIALVENFEEYYSDLFKIIQGLQVYAPLVSYDEIATLGQLYRYLWETEKQQVETYIENATKNSQALRPVSESLKNTSEQRSSSGSIATDREDSDSSSVDGSANSEDGLIVQALRRAVEDCLLRKRFYVTTLLYWATKAELALYALKKYL